MSKENRDNYSEKLVGDLFSGKFAVEEGLRRLRTRLLDLSPRNRLLSYRHPKGRSVQFVNVSSLDILFRKLLDNKNVSIIPVPEPEPMLYEGRRPDAKQHAENYHGINTGYEFCRLCHNSRNARNISSLQTLYYPPELEVLLRKIAREAQGAIEETGTNMLFLIFGFLEFYDSVDSDRPLLAPLLSMPVTLNKGEIDPDFRTYQYDLSYSGDDVTENLTLREKLRQDFLLNLPDLDDEDEPEKYFEKIESAVRKKKRWKVRRQLTLGMLFFGKLAIWTDLDTTRWPMLSEQPLLKMIFEGVTFGSGNFFAEDYNVDEHPKANIPLVFDADSSQHSAIIDVISGKNIVINGPPGTGKSQTISNVIAVALVEGKTVLFVSEKLAALEVVRRMLTKAHLGDFCLELHSHKTQKKRLIQDIRERVERRFALPPDYRSKLRSLQNHKTQLKRYAELMSSRIGNALGLTVNEVFWAVEKWRQELGDYSGVLHSVVISRSDQLTYDDIKQQRTRIEVLAKLYEAVGSFERGHPWWGYTPNALKPGDEEDIAEILEAAISEARELDDMANEYMAYTGEKRQPDTEMIVAITENLQKVPGLPEKLQAQLLSSFFSSSDPTGQMSKSILTELTNKITKARYALTFAYSILETGHSLSVKTAHKIIQSANSTLLSEVLSASIADIHKWESSLNSSISFFKATFSIAKPCDFRVYEIPLAGIEEKLAVLASLNIGEASMADLKNSAQTVLRLCSDFLVVLENVNTVLRKRKISFDGSPRDLQELANSYGLEELHLNIPLTSELIEKVGVLAGIGLAHLTIEELQTIYGELRFLPSSFRAALNSMRSVALTVGLEFDGSLSAVNHIVALAKIAKSCPYELIEHRRSSFAWQHMPELMEKAEMGINHEATMRRKLEPVFYLDALPAIDDLKRSIRALRRKKSVLCFIDAEWRRAKKIIRPLVKQRNKMTSFQCAETISNVVAWVEYKDNICLNREFHDAFGSLFKGLETDLNKIRTLYQWYKEGHSELLRYPGLINKVDLTSLEANMLEQLAASADQLDAHLSVLLEGDQLIESTIGPHIATLTATKQKGWPAYIEMLQELLKEMQDAISFLPQYTKSAISPKRVLELVQARRELNVLLPGPPSVIDAPQIIAISGGKSLGLRGLTENDMLQDWLKGTSETCNNILSLVELLCDFVSSSCSPVSFQNFIKAKLDLDTAIKKVAPWRSFSSWNDYIDNAETALNEIRSILGYFSRYVRKEKSVKEGFEAIFNEGKASEILTALGEEPAIIDLFGGNFTGVDTDLDALAQTHHWGVSVVNLDLPSKVVTRLLEPEAKKNLRETKRLFEGMSEAYLRLQENLAKLKNYGTFDWKEWQKAVRSKQQRDLPEEIRIRLEIARENLQSLLPWSQYLAIRKDCKEDGLEAFPKLIESKTIPSTLLPQAFELSVYQSLGRSIYVSFPELLKFNRIAHERVRTNYRELDREIIDLNGKVLACQIDAQKNVPEGESGIRVGDLTELQLLKKELGKQKRHIPIRQLVKRAGRALLAYKPCFMMGPLSVAQYLEHGAVKFDLVVMDEASQLKPEDALGAVARGGQLVIVGDPKQLPPTSFFERMLESGSDEDEEDPSILQGTESILDICQQLFYPMRTLRWHYRSRHESLIAFSNHCFYKNLIIFPSPYTKHARMGVRFRHIKKGVYRDRQNIPEAQKITDAIMEHMLKFSDESLGVVTLNQTQRDLIEELLDKKLRIFDEGKKFLSHWEEEGWPFFVKNLENVQGDERDVIFISTTFGKAPGTDKVRQNFGPISRPTGWRRLNVLFTRSRKRIELFTSMMPEDIIIDEKTPLGTQALRNYLYFARGGILPSNESGKSVRDPDSDFEISVAKVLQEKGYDVTPQLGVAGFYIDLAIRNPNRPGEYLAAIECDGATYHSGFSVRDRDRIRQEILESLGWKGRIWRIWSTDWFYNRVGEINKLMNFLDERKMLSQMEDSIEYEVEEMVEDTVPEMPSGCDEDVPDSIEFPEAGDRFVEVGDQVSYCFVSKPKEKYVVHIVEGKSNPDLGIINEKTGVAQALLNLSVGEENDLQIPGNTNRTVRVLKIERI